MCRVRCGREGVAQVTQGNVTVILIMEGVLVVEQHARLMEAPAVCHSNITVFEEGMSPRRPIATIEYWDLKSTEGE